MTEPHRQAQSVAIRTIDRADLPPLRFVLEKTGLFPPEMLEPLVEPYLSGQAPHHWLTACRDGRSNGFAYAEPERMTEGTFNLLAIAVDPAAQRRGVGRALVGALEDRLRRIGGRVLIVETSSLDDYAGTRTFYAGEGFSEEARIRDFYSDGQDKIVFWKRL